MLQFKFGMSGIDLCLLINSNSCFRRKLSQLEGSDDALCQSSAVDRHLGSFFSVLEIFSL